MWYYAGAAARFSNIQTRVFIPAAGRLAAAEKDHTFDGGVTRSIMDNNYVARRNINRIISEVGKRGKTT